MFGIALDGTTGLEGVQTVLTALLGYMQSLVTQIISTPILLISVGVFVLGAVIGLAYRLIHG